MNFIKYFFVVLAIIFFTSCSKNTEKESLIKEKNLESQVYEAYEEGMKSLNEGDAIFAAKKFWSKANVLSYDEFTDVVNRISLKSNVNL